MKTHALSPPKGTIADNLNSGAGAITMHVTNLSIDDSGGSGCNGSGGGGGSAGHHQGA